MIDPKRYIHVFKHDRQELYLDTLTGHIVEDVDEKYKLTDKQFNDLSHIPTYIYGTDKEFYIIDYSKNGETYEGDYRFAALGTIAKYLGLSITYTIGKLKYKPISVFVLNFGSPAEEAMFRLYYADNIVNYTDANTNQILKTCKLLR